jgi:hypothetical protein
VDSLDTVGRRLLAEGLSDAQLLATFRHAALERGFHLTPETARGILETLDGGDVVEEELP